MVKRIEWLDSIKGFSILFVVYCHYIMLPEKTFLGNVLMTMATCGVPCFMMVSGALMHNARSFSWGKYFKRIFTIYLVMCLWKAIYLAVSFVILDIQFTFNELIRYLFLFGGLSNVPSSVTWYMVAFILVMLVYPISYHLLKDESLNGKVYMFLLLLAFVSGFGVTFINFILSLISNKFGISTINFNGLYESLPLRQHSNLLFFFLLGGVLFKNDEHIKQKLKMIKFGGVLPIALIVIGVFGLMVMKFITSRTFLWENINIDNGYQRVSTIFFAVGVWLTFSLYSNKVSSFLAKYIGQYTMGVYYLHFIILFVCARCIYPHIPQYIVGMNFVKTLLIVCVSVIITRIMLKIPVVKMLVK